jgi:hypothetical protein
VKSLRWFLILTILGLSSSATMADGIDPALGVKGTDPVPTLWPGSVTFTINSDDASCDTTCNFTSGAFFINTGTITNFDFKFDTGQGPFTALEGSAFPIVMTVVPGFEALLSGGTIFPGSPCFEGCASNEIFGDFVFEMDGVTLGSNGETNVTVTSNVPEPASIILMLTGLGAMGLRRLRRNKVPS